MQFLNDFVKLFMDKCSFPQGAKDCFAQTYKAIEANEDYSNTFARLRDEYMYPTAHNLHAALDGLNKLAEDMGVSNYTLHMMFLVTCAQILRERYKENGYSDELFWASADDLRCKLIECIDCEEVYGTFVGGWFHGFYDLTRFTLGRFEYEKQEFNRDTVTLKCGYVVEEDSTIINFHIPSSGISLTDEVRMDSYRKAYEFYKPYFGDGPVVFCCGSWLLYKGYLDFLPEQSNIRKFINDFELIENEPSDDFHNGWRVFGKDSDLPIEQLPERTSLQRQFKKYLMDGNKTGHGFGIIVFDGEKIINTH